MMEEDSTLSSFRPPDHVKCEVVWKSGERAALAEVSQLLLCGKEELQLGLES